MASQQPPATPQQPATGSGPVQIDRATAERFAEATRYFERSYRNAPAVGTRHNAGLVWGTIARATSNIGPCNSSGAYGTGTVTFQKDTGSALADDSTMAGISVKNLTSKTIAAGSSARLGMMWALGSWWVVAVWDCSLLS